MNVFPELVALVMKRWKHAEVRLTRQVSNLGRKPLCVLWARPDGQPPQDALNTMQILKDLHGMSPETVRFATPNPWQKGEAEPGRVVVSTETVY